MCHFLENGKCRILTVNACSDCCKFAKTTEQFEAAETAAKSVCLLRRKNGGINDRA